MNKEAIEWIGDHLWTIIILSSLFIQIVPIKIHPWTALFKWIGTTITNNACTKLDGVIEKINKIESNVAENEKDRIRWEILDFANSCHGGKKHTRDEFRHIDKLNKKYRKLLEQTNDENGEFEVEYDYIKELYQERIRKNDFLIINKEDVSK